MFYSLTKKGEICLSITVQVEWKQQPEWLESTLKDLPTASELKTWKMIGDVSYLWHVLLS